MGLNNLDDSKMGVQKFLERNPSTCLVAVANENLENEKIVASILVGNDGRRAYIYHTAVHPDFRKQGIAKILVESVINELTGLGINKASLVVFEKNISGNEFWEKLGFTVREDLVYRDKALVDIERLDT